VRPAALTVLALVIATAAPAEEPVIGGPCEGCENVFVGIPDTEEIGPRERIAPKGEKGEALVIEGTVRDEEGQPVAGIIVYAYHTNAKGVYPRSDTRHGGLRGWARTDGEGHYRFDTIRPGGYPGGSTPQHVHMHVIEPGRCTYYIDDIVFDDDPLLTAGRRRGYVRGRGGSGLGHPERDEEGVWHVRRDITLGRNIPDYPGSAQ
jgi:protocatechuate 3,4-dioxygenase beta subunit